MTTFMLMIFFADSKKALILALQFFEILPGANQALIPNPI